MSVWGNGVIALNTLQQQAPKKFNSSSFSGGGSAIWDQAKPNPKIDVCPWVVFQDYFRYWMTASAGSHLARVSNTWAWSVETIVPQDHADYTDESISTVDKTGAVMHLPISATTSLVLL